MQAWLVEETASASCEALHIVRLLGAVALTVTEVWDNVPRVVDRMTEVSADCLQNSAGKSAGTSVKHPHTYVRWCGTLVQSPYLKVCMMLVYEASRPLIQHHRAFGLLFGIHRVNLRSLRYHSP